MTPATPPMRSAGRGRVGARSGCPARRRRAGWAARASRSWYGLSGPVARSVRICRARPPCRSCSEELVSTAMPSWSCGSHQRSVRKPFPPPPWSNRSRYWPARQRVPGDPEGVAGRRAGVRVPARFASAPSVPGRARRDPRRCRCPAGTGGTGPGPRRWSTGRRPPSSGCPGRCHRPGVADGTVRRGVDASAVERAVVHAERPQQRVTHQHRERLARHHLEDVRRPGRCRGWSTRSRCRPGSAARWRRCCARARRTSPVRARSCCPVAPRG